VRFYFDPSCLIALYLAELMSGEVRAFVEKQNQPVLVNQLQELEFRNALARRFCAMKSPNNNWP